MPTTPRQCCVLSRLPCFAVGYRSSSYAAKLKASGVDAKNLEGGIVRWVSRLHAARDAEAHRCHTGRGAQTLTALARSCCLRGISAACRPPPAITPRRHSLPRHPPPCRPRSATPWCAPPAPGRRLARRRRACMCTANSLLFSQKSTSLLCSRTRSSLGCAARCRPGRGAATARSEAALCGAASAALLEAPPPPPPPPPTFRLSPSKPNSAGPAWQQTNQHMPLSLPTCPAPSAPPLVPRRTANLLAPNSLHACSSASRRGPARAPCCPTFGLLVCSAIRFDSACRHAALFWP